MRLDLIEGALVRLGGPEGAPLILAMSGFGDDGSAFAGLFETGLVAAHRLAALDMPGFGAAPVGRDALGVAALAARVNAIGAALSPDRPAVLLGHSIAGAIMTEAAHVKPAAAVISVEGNLVDEDAYFSGTAADYDDPRAFKEAFVSKLWDLAAKERSLRRFTAAVAHADAEALWRLGKDARAGAGDHFGRRYAALRCPSLYYWCEATTTRPAQAFLKARKLDALQYPCAHHWPMQETPERMAEDLVGFLYTLDLG